MGTREGCPYLSGALPLDGGVVDVKAGVKVFGDLALRVARETNCGIIMISRRG